MFYEIIDYIVYKYKKRKVSLYLSNDNIGNHVSFCGEGIFACDMNSTVGDYCYIGRNVCITRASIGRYCSIADNVTIGAGEHNTSKCSTNTRLYQDKCDAYEMLTSGDVSIGNDVWIGCDSIIRRGVTIGDGVVVGANSFVNKDVPDFAIVAGNPATIIRYRFSEEKCERIKNSRWWDLELEDAKVIAEKIDRN